MRSHAKGALLFLVLCTGATGVAIAQDREQEREQDQRPSSRQANRATRETPDPQQKATAPRPLTLGEGLAILGAALDSRHHHADFSADCSHFVHGLYERAGFPYEYASSSDLYAGVDEFRRVTNPQPGDLAVWRGHAGIVVNPVQHSFFSALRSGPGVDSYDSTYWKRKGRPRFFRYVKPVPSSVLSTSVQTASWRPSTSGNTAPHEAVAEDPVPDGPEESASEPVASANVAEDPAVNEAMLRVLTVNSARPKPDQVATAFLQACQDSEKNLRGRDLFKSAQSLVVFNHFEVKKVHLAANQGWAEVQIDEPGSLTGGRAQVHKHSERQRWPLTRRDNQSWELAPAPNTIYLPQHIAERILAHELAQLTEDRPDAASRTPEKAELARLLGVLLEK